MLKCVNLTGTQIYMLKILILGLISLFTLLDANTSEQTQFMQNIADKANKKIRDLKELPRNKTHISNVCVEENYTLSISFKTNFVDKHEVDNFKNINEIKMKRKFCRGEFYKRMEDGLTVSFSYYTPRNELIAYFELDEEHCHEAHLVYNSIRYNPN